MDNSNGFKMTEIGHLPEDWEVTILDSSTNMTMGQSPPSSTYNELGIGMPFLQGKAEFHDKYPNPIKYTTQPLKIAPKGTVLISVRAPVGDVNIANLDYCIGRGLASLTFKDGSNDFLFYLLKFYKSEIEKEGTGSTFKAISKQKLANTKIPLPPLPEQQKIASVLSTIQEAKEKTENVIKATKELKKSMMKHLFTYGSVPVKSPLSRGDLGVCKAEEKETHPRPLLLEGRQPTLKETEIGMIPEHWEVVKIGTLSEIQSGSTPLRQKAQYYDGDIPWVKTLDLNEGKVISTQERITELGFKSIRGKLRPVKTVMIAMYGGAGTVGKTGMLGIPSATNQAVCCIEPNPEKFDSHYLLYYLIHIRPQWMSYAIGTRKDPNISKGIIERKEIPLPPLRDQATIAENLLIIDIKIEAEENKKRALEALFKTLLSLLMTGKIRVKDLDI